MAKLAGHRAARGDAGGWAFRAALIAGAIALGLAGLSRSPAANWSPTTELGADGTELQRLQEVRESLELRRVWQRNLRRQVRALAAEREALRGQREQTSAMLQSERQRARALEQRLDRLVPRLLARAAEVRERRARTARALAELASKSRRVQVDSTVRARMLAISPLMLEKLRSVESNLAALQEQSDRMVERYARIVRSLPELMTAEQRLSRELEQNRRLRQVSLARLHELDADVRLLGDQHARLTRRFLHAEAAAVRAAPQADQRALSDPTGPRGPRLRGAAVAKGSLQWEGLPAHVVQAEHRSAWEVRAAVPVGNDVAGLANVGGEAEWPTMLQPTRPLTPTLRGADPEVWPSASHDAVSRATPLDVVFQPNRDLPGVGTAASDDERWTPPLLPVPEELRRRTQVARGRPEMTIPAAPGQGVAAPVEGKVVFAGSFKSYGLLLIIEHEREYHTLLWGLARLDIGLGEHVQVGQIVGIMDARGDDPPVLHVERRRNGRPINLAASSSGNQG